MQTKEKVINSANDKEQKKVVKIKINVPFVVLIILILVFGLLIYKIQNDDLNNIRQTVISTSTEISSDVKHAYYVLTKENFIDNVPYINQFVLGYPTGCEAVSATMAAKYNGYDIDVATIIANTPTQERGIWSETVTEKVERQIIDNNTGEIRKENYTTTEKIYYAGNPFEVFVGHPSKRLNQGSYGCFAKPIEIALQKSNISCTNISGCETDELFKQIQEGKPVIVWCIKNAGDVVEKETWQYIDGTGGFTKLYGEHCAVMIGYDENHVYLNDPSAGKEVKQPKDKFLENWEKLYKQAIVVNKI